jgi:thiol-disulfide isomerase/thioredoxin
LTARAAAAALAVCLGLACLGLACRAPEAPVAHAPDFSLEDLGGGRVSLADLRGKPAVIDFWATWCPPCVFQIPVLNELQVRFGERVHVVGIAVDAGGRESVEPFAREHGIRYRVLLGDESLAQRFGALGFPTLYVVRPDGSIDSQHVGLAEVDELDRKLALLLASERPPAREEEGAAARTAGPVSDP